MIELHPGEQLILLRRRHWLPIISEVLVLLIIGLFPLLITGESSILPESFEFGGGSYLPYTLFFEAAWLFFIWIILFTLWTNYYLDVLVVTNSRLIDIDQIGFFARNVAEMRLENIQDTTVEIIGLLPSLLHFGNLHIQSAGQSKEFVIRNLQDPQMVREAISKQCHALITSK